MSRSVVPRLAVTEDTLAVPIAHDLPQVSVLLVDDHPESLLALEAVLEPLGQRLVRARSGGAALQAVLGEQFAVILMDIRMPDLDGYETLALLRTRKQSRHTPIIFLTGCAEEEDQLRSYASGAVDILQKPFEPSALRAKVSVFVELEQRVVVRTRELAQANAALEAEIEHRKKIEQQLIEQAHRDGLTGLANRKLLLEHLHHAVARFHRQGSPRSAVMMLDLDRFKTVNDSYGHFAGDQLLVEVARRLERCLRDVDTAARFGGDEFAILLDGVDEILDVTRIADRIHAALAAPIQLDGVEVTISASIGIALVDLDYERSEDLLRDADTALYRAKDAGRARTCLFSSE